MPDFYHMHTMGEDYLAFFNHYVEKVGHIQFADSPGRHQPGTGQIDFDNLFSAIDACGYKGWLGAEYIPSGPKSGTALIGLSSIASPRPE